MLIKLLFSNLILIFFLNFKAVFSSNLSELEKLPKDPFIMICNFLDVESFKKLNLTSNSIRNNIQRFIQISENANELEVNKLIQKFETFLKAKKAGISMEEYFWLFSLTEMKHYDLTSDDILAYHKIQQRKAILKTAPLKFGRVHIYEKLNKKLYNCFYEDFKKRSPKFNGESIEKRKIVLLQWGKIDFLSPCIDKFKNVTDLHIFNNNLFFLPQEIGNCKTLKYIDLKYNNLVSLPPTIVKCIALEKLILTENPKIKEKEIKQLLIENKKLKIEFIEPIYLYYQSQN